MKTKVVNTTDKVLGQIKILNPIPEQAKLPFVQQLQLVHEGQIIGQASWHSPEGPDGVVQLLDLEIAQDHQRHNLASNMLMEIYQQIAILHKRVGVPARRIWIAVEQKRQVNARAFLSRHGYHHVGTMKNLHRRQDTLIYQRAFD